VTRVIKLIEQHPEASWAVETRKGVVEALQGSTVLTLASAPLILRLSHKDGNHEAAVDKILTLADTKLLDEMFSVCRQGFDSYWKLVRQCEELQLYSAASSLALTAVRRVPRQANVVDNFEYALGLSDKLTEDERKMSLLSMYSFVVENATTAASFTDDIRSKLAEHIKTRHPALHTKYAVRQVRQVMASQFSAEQDRVTALKAALKAAVEAAAAQKDDGAMPAMIETFCQMLKPSTAVTQRDLQYVDGHRAGYRSASEILAYSTKQVTSLLSKLYGTLGAYYDLASFMQGPGAKEFSKGIIEKAEAAMGPFMESAMQTCLQQVRQPAGCNTNHQTFHNFCNRCRGSQYTKLHACFTAVMLAKALVPPDAFVGVIGRICGSTSILHNREVKRGLSEYLTEGYLRAACVLPTGLPQRPTFEGLKQPVLDLSHAFQKISEEPKLLRSSLDESATVEQVASFAADFIASYDSELQGAAAKVTQAIRDDAIDAELLLSLSWEEMRETLFDGEVESLEHIKATFGGSRKGSVSLEALAARWLAARRFSLAVKNGVHGHLDGGDVAQWLVKGGDGSSLLAFMARQGLDNRLLCDLSDDEIDLLIEVEGQDLPLYWSTLRDKVRAIRNCGKRETCGFASLPREVGPKETHVVVLGNTGAGKSTMLNALLGEGELLPTNCMRACTATIVEMVFAEAAPRGQPYAADIEMVGIQDWRTELTEAVAAIEAHRQEEAKEDPPENDEALQAAALVADRAKGAVSKLKSVYGEAYRSEMDVDALMSDPRLEGVLGETFDLHAKTGRDLKRLSAKYVDSTNDLSEGALWPLVKRVRFAGPWAALTSGVKLVDAPGTHDDNAARDQTIKRNLAEADVVLLVSNIRRAINDKSVKDWVPLSLRQDLIKEGKLGQVAYVATQTDEFHRSELVKNLRLAPTATSLEAALARNAFTRSRLSESFWQGIESDELPVNNPETHFDIPVFTCSAVEYQKHLGERGEEDPSVFVAAEDTQIPLLRAFLAHISTDTTAAPQSKAGRSS